MVSRIEVIKTVGPKLVPFFASVALFFYMFPLKMEETMRGVIIKCLPIVALCFFILLNGFNFQFRYSYSRRILTGLLFSIIGDACLVYPKEYFMFGVISFATAHIFYFSALGIRPVNIRLALLIFTCALPIMIFYVPFISNYMLKVLVPMYTMLLLSILWRSVSRLQLFSKNIEWTWTKMCCSIGALFFVMSDSVLSFDEFIHEIPYCHPIVLFTYYAAQLGITLSVVDSHQSNEINKQVIQHNDIINGIHSMFNYLKSIYYEDNLDEVYSYLNSEQTSNGTKGNNESKARSSTSRKVISNSN